VDIIFKPNDLTALLRNYKAINLDSLISILGHIGKLEKIKPNYIENFTYKNIKNSGKLIQDFLSYKNYDKMYNSITSSSNYDEYMTKLWAISTIVRDRLLEKKIVSQYVEKETQQEEMWGLKNQYNGGSFAAILFIENSKIN
jgi:hypothetical protein